MQKSIEKNEKFNLLKPDQQHTEIDLEPTMQELANIKEELEREIKLDQIFLQKNQQIKIEDKHKRR